MTDNIKVLVEKVLGGDTDAFETLIHTYEKKVYNLALRYMRNHDDAMDVVQETFISVYNNLDTYRKEAQFSTWLYRITFNKCMDALRKRETTRKKVISFEEGVALPDVSDSPEREYEERERLGTVMKIIDGLPEEQKNVVILRYIKDLDYSQISEILDINPGTVKSRLNRARLKIKDQLEKMNCL